MKRPETRHDRFPGFHRAAQASTVADRLAAIDAALAAGIGHKLFTALVVNHAKGENQRYYSDQLPTRIMIFPLARHVVSQIRI